MIDNMAAIKALIEDGEFLSALAGGNAGYIPDDDIVKHVAVAAVEALRPVIEAEVGAERDLWKAQAKDHHAAASERLDIMIERGEEIERLKQLLRAAEGTEPV